MEVIVYDDGGGSRSTGVYAQSLCTLRPDVA